MDVITKTIVKTIFPFIALFGLAVMFHGHLTPGGSFPGGAIVASGVALVLVTFGLERAERLFSEEKAHVIESFAALLLAVLILYESFVRQYVDVGGRAFMIWSSPTVLMLNVTGGIMVMSALVLIVFLVTKE